MFACRKEKCQNRKIQNNLNLWCRMFTVTSEIYQENNFQTVCCKANGKFISKFKFKYPNEDTTYIVDQDGDLIVKRKNIIIESNTKTYGVIELEHYITTEIPLVGLQVWRGALLLADYLFHKRYDLLHGKQILELGAGVGLTSIAAAIYADKVFCTDINVGGILGLIKHNFQRNVNLFQNSVNNKNRSNVEVLEFNFKESVEKHSKELLQAIDLSDVIIAADVIYDNDITDAFINVIDWIFWRGQIVDKQKVILIALEKRYVFTAREFDTIAPMYEYFIQNTMEKNWNFEYITVNFPQYFSYERTKHLILLQLTNKHSK